MNEKPPMKHPDRHGATDACAVIAHLKRCVQAWIDGDRVLSADGSFLLAALDRALEGLAGEDPGGMQAGIETFTHRVQVLIDAGVLGEGDGQPQFEAAALLVASLLSAGATDGEARRRLDDTFRG
jgi:hypothetical protein